MLRWILSLGSCAHLSFELLIIFGCLYCLLSFLFSSYLCEGDPSLLSRWVMKNNALLEPAIPRPGENEGTVESLQGSLTLERPVL